MLVDYENNSVEGKRIESDRISGLLDQTLDAATIIDEEGKSSTLLVSVLRARASDLRSGRDVTFRRRMDTLLARFDGTKAKKTMQSKATHSNPVREMINEL